MLTKTGVKLRAWEGLYKAVAQTLLIYGSESWVVTGAMLKVLEGFRHWAARCVAGMTYWRMDDG